MPYRPERLSTARKYSNGCNPKVRLLTTRCGEPLTAALGLSSSSPRRMRQKRRLWQQCGETAFFISARFRPVVQVLSSNNIEACCRVVVLISGNGSNLQAIIDHCNNSRHLLRWWLLSAMCNLLLASSGPTRQASRHAVLITGILRPGGAFDEALNDPD